MERIFPTTHPKSNQTANSKNKKLQQTYFNFSFSLQRNRRNVVLHQGNFQKRNKKHHRKNNKRTPLDKRPSTSWPCNKNRMRERPPQLSWFYDVGYNILPTLLYQNSLSSLHSKGAWKSRQKLPEKRKKNGEVRKLIAKNQQQRTYRFKTGFCFDKIKDEVWITKNK